MTCRTTPYFNSIKLEPGLPIRTHLGSAGGSPSLPSSLLPTGLRFVSLLRC